MAYKKNERSHENALIVSYRSIPMILAAGLLLIALSFFAGFFWGQRYKTEQFLERFEHNTLSDQIYSSMFSLYDASFDTAAAQSTESSESKEAEQIDIKISDEASDESSSSDTTSEQTDSVERVADLSTNYYAQLVGFGSRNRAEAFVKKLAARGIQVQLQKRLGKSPKNGKTTTWYQVTTPIFNDRHTLESLVARLQKEENLHDIRIITLT